MKYFKCLQEASSTDNICLFVKMFVFLRGIKISFFKLCQDVRHDRLQLQSHLVFSIIPFLKGVLFGQYL